MEGALDGGLEDDLYRLPLASVDAAAARGASRLEVEIRLKSMVGGGAFLVYHKCFFSGVESVSIIQSERGVQCQALIFCPLKALRVD